MSHVDFSIPVSEQLALPAKEWKSNHPDCHGKIVFLHGFTNHSGNYAYLGEWFSDKGFDFIAYDHRDHGSSPLRNQPCSLEDMVNDAKSVIQFAFRESGDKPVLLMGSSMGGALSILASQGDTQKLLSGLVLWAPQVVSTSRRKAGFALISFLNSFASGVKIPSKSISVSNLPKQCDDKALTDYIAQDDLMLGNPSIGLLHRVLAMGDKAAQANFDKGFKVLMLMGGKDTLIFKHDIKLFVQRVEQSEADIVYKFYPDNRHMLWGDLNREELYKDVMQWYSNF